MPTRSQMTTSSSLAPATADSSELLLQRSAAGGWPYLCTACAYLFYKCSV